MKVEYKNNGFSGHTYGSLVVSTRTSTSTPSVVALTAKQPANSSREERFVDIELTADQSRDLGNRLLKLAGPVPKPQPPQDIIVHAE